MLGARVHPGSRSPHGAVAPKPGRAQEWVTASLEQSTTAVLTAPELAALNREVQEVIDRHTSAGSGREAALREGSAGLRRIRVYYDGFPLPLD